MQLSFWGATETVTGSKYLLTLGSKHLLIDCGLFQGYKELRLRNWSPLPLKPQQIDAVILTHAHIDHTGYLPLLAKNGFKGPIYATPGTKGLCSILLPDSGHLQEEDARRANKYGYAKHKPALPLYTREDAEKSLDQFVTIDFQEEIRIFQDSFFTFFKAGHIQGSALVKVQHKKTSVLFSGDIGRLNDPIMKPPQQVEACDYLVIESTYGDRQHSKEPPQEKLARIIKDTVKRGGSVIIPAFAVGRTQSILYYLYLLKKNQQIPDIPIFVDSPMATQATRVFCHFPEELRLNESTCHQVSQIATYVQSVEESKKIDNSAMPSIIISASGMVTGGRILHHLKAFAPHERNTILFTGFQAAQTRGARMLAGEPAVKIHGQMIPIRAQVEMIDSISAHADYEEILHWMKCFKFAPKKVFITHGEAQAAQAFKQKIEKALGWHCFIPHYLQTVNL